MLFRSEDLAAGLRDVGGEGLGDDPFDSSIDASWLGRAPGDEDGDASAQTNGSAEQPGSLEAGA